MNLKQAKKLRKDVGLGQESHRDVIYRVKNPIRVFSEKDPLSVTRRSAIFLGQAVLSQQCNRKHYHDLKKEFNKLNHIQRGAYRG